MIIMIIYIILKNHLIKNLNKLMFNNNLLILNKKIWIN